MESRPDVISKDMINFSTPAIKYRQKAVGNQENHPREIINTTNPVYIFSIQLLKTKQQMERPKISLIQKNKATVYYCKKNFLNQKVFFAKGMQYQENIPNNTKMNGVDRWIFYNYDDDEADRRTSLPSIFFGEYTIVLKIFPLPIPVLSCHQQHPYTYP